MATASANNTISYLHTNYQGAPILATDATSQVVWQADYEPFGKANLINPSIALNLRLPGQYHDTESGLHQNYYRNYDPATGRYIESDPIGIAGGINTYAYVGNNPLNRIDPLGLTAIPVPIPLPPPGGQSTGIGGYDWSASFWPKPIRDLFGPQHNDQADPLDDYPADPDELGAA